MYRPKIVQSCRINDVLIRVEVIICDSIVTLFSSLSFITSDDMIWFGILISRVESLYNQKVGPSSMSHFRSLRPYLGASLTSTLSGTTYWNIVVSPRDSLWHDAPSFNFCFLKRTHIQGFCPWNPILPSRCRFPSPWGSKNFAVHFLSCSLLSCFFCLRKRPRFFSLVRLTFSTTWNSKPSGSTSLSLLGARLHYQSTSDALPRTYRTYALVGCRTLSPL